MQAFLRKVFGIYQNEGTIALQFGRMSLCWALGSSLLDTLSDGLFLEKIGASRLPTVYLCIAIIMILSSSLILYALKKTSPYRVLTTAMIIGVTICFGACVGTLGTPLPPHFWYGLKIASKMFFAVMIACSWTFIDQYHDLQEAKRVYAIYSSCYFLGTILAGSMIHLLLPFTSFPPLFILAALSLVASFKEAQRIALHIQPSHDNTSEGIFSASRDTVSSVIKSIFCSRFALLLLLLSLSIQLLLTVTEFNYMRSFDAFFSKIPSTSGQEGGEIARFLGQWRAWIAACNICVGTLLYSRFVRKLGLSSTVLITPLFFLGVYAFWVFRDGLGLAILGLIAADGVLFTFEDNGFNLMSNAVPTKLRPKVRIINDSFFEPIGMLLSSFLLLSIPSSSCVLGLLLAIGCLTLSLCLRRLYSSALILNLKDNAIHFERKLGNWFSLFPKKELKDAKKKLIQTLHLSPTIDLMNMKAIIQLQELDLLVALMQEAFKSNTKGKIDLLQLLYKSSHLNHPNVIEEVEKWLATSNSIELHKACHLFLAHLGLQSLEQAEQHLNHSDLTLRSAAIMSIKKVSCHPLVTSTLSRTIASKQLDLMLHSERIDEVASALHILEEDPNTQTIEKILPYLNHPTLLIKRSAAKAIHAKSKKALRHHAPLLIETLKDCRDPTVRCELLLALQHIADTNSVKELLTAAVYLRPQERRLTEETIVSMGLEMIPLLLNLIKEVALPERARILASKVLGRLAPSQLQANMLDMLDIEIDRAYFYFYFAHTIQASYPHIDLNNLKDALLTGYQSVIDFIIHLLATAGSLEDPDLFVRSLHSHNEKVHAHAIESLEKTCPLKFFSLILPLIDDVPLEEKMKACLAWRGDYPTLSFPELLHKLDRSFSLLDKIVSAQLKAQLKMPSWKEDLLRQMEQTDEPFHQYAHELLKT